MDKRAELHKKMFADLEFLSEESMHAEDVELTSKKGFSRNQTPLDHQSLNPLVIGEQDMSKTMFLADTCSSNKKPFFNTSVVSRP